MVIGPLAQENFCIGIVKSLYPPPLKKVAKGSCSHKRRIPLLLVIGSLAQENFCIGIVKSLYPPSLKKVAKGSCSHKRRIPLLLVIGLSIAQHLGQQCIEYVTADTKDRIAKNTL